MLVDDFDLEKHRPVPIELPSAPNVDSCDLLPTFTIYGNTPLFSEMFPEYAESVDQWHLSNQVTVLIRLMEGDREVPLTDEQYMHLTRGLMSLALQFTHADPSRNPDNTYDIYLDKLSIFNNPQNYAMFRDAFLTSLDSAKNTLPGVNSSLIKDGLGDSCFKTVADYYYRGVDPITETPIGTTSRARDLLNMVAMGQVVDPDLLKVLGDGFFVNYRDRYDITTGSVSGVLAALNEYWGVSYNSPRAQKGFSKRLQRYKDEQKYILEDISNINVQDRDVVLGRMVLLNAEKRNKDAYK